MLDYFKYCKVRNVTSPSRGTSEAAGIDFYIPFDLTEEIVKSKMQITNSWLMCEYNNDGFLTSLLLKPGQSILLPCGIHTLLPKGFCLKMENKSGVASKKHLLVGGCIVDSDYTGEIHINLHNVGKDDVIITAGEKIIQGIIYKVELPEFMEFNGTSSLYKNSCSERGEGAFGSTGTH